MFTPRVITSQRKITTTTNKKYEIAADFQTLTCFLCTSRISSWNMKTIVFCAVIVTKHEHLWLVLGNYYLINSLVFAIRRRNCSAEDDDDDDKIQQTEKNSYECRMCTYLSAQRKFSRNTHGRMCSKRKILQ